MITVHNPKGDPCARCGKNASDHYVKHWPEGNPCAKCGLAAGKHLRLIRSGFRRKTPAAAACPSKDIHDCGSIVSVDGEGVGRAVHRYTMMVAADGAGHRVWSTRDVGPGGELRTAECLDFLLALPEPRIFAYGFGYDLSKMLVDIPNAPLYMLFRPELRMRESTNRKGETLRNNPMPIHWNGYKLNWMASRFSVSKDGRRRVVWDILKFFQCSFLRALRDWKIGKPADLAVIEEMKNSRSTFDDASRESILRYSALECMYNGQLVQALIQAHADAGLPPLKKFYGAGTTSGLILDTMGIRARRRDAPKNMVQAVSQSFFGGRFENSVCGRVAGKPFTGSAGGKEFHGDPVVWSYDISSAYPYHTRFLPCMDHGFWSLTKDRNAIESARAALVHTRVHQPGKRRPWGPFPFRLKGKEKGCICFPARSGGGWIWRDEYLAGEALFDNVEFRQAWVLNGDCDCDVFERMSHFYRERIRIGKEGAGMVFKFGPNGVYGKLAQSVGMTPPYQCWIWASLITSNTRGQILRDILGAHKDWSNLLAIATDGVYTLERLSLPAPRDTGTSNLIDEKGKPVNKPLGGWEEKPIKGSVFFARPGIYFESGLSQENMKEIIRARGIGRMELVRYAKKIEQAYLRGDESFTLKSQLDRFCGAKSSLHVKGQDVVRSTEYGQWVKRPITVSFAPNPKRRNPMRLPGEDFARLGLRSFVSDTESAPYSRAIGMQTEDAVELIQSEIELYEQPDGDMELAYAEA